MKLSKIKILFCISIFTLAVIFYGTVRISVADEDAGIFVEVNGDVGVGTTTPEYLLQLLKNGSTAPIRLDIHNTGIDAADDSILSFETEGQIEFGMGIDRSTGKFTITKGNIFGTDDYITLDNIGKVGIGTTAPSEKLDVNGSAKATFFIGDGSLLTNVPETDPIFSVWDKSAGISITESQISDLSHFTTANEADPIFSSWDKSFGISITESQISDLSHFTTADETDPQVGLNTLNYTSKWDGTALIAGTIFDNGNIGIGTDTPAEKLDVNGNLFLSGGDLITDRWNLSSSNTFIGVDVVGSGSLQPEGLYNTAIGYQSLYDNTTGGYNFAMGSLSLRSNTIGMYNIAVGVNALRFSTTAYGNIAFGVNALMSNISGSVNLALGVNALLNSTGNFNTAMGFAAGDNLTTGNSNIIIGSRIDAPVATGSNQMSIGNLIFATGVDGIGQTVSTGNVGIGTADPTSRLQVTGLPEHVDNAAAIAAGLTVGAFYRTGDLLKVVH